MRLSWVSGDGEPQQVQYGEDGTIQTSQVSTFSQNDMCSEFSFSIFLVPLSVYIHQV